MKFYFKKRWRGNEVDYRDNENRKSNIIIYTTEDGLAKIEDDF